MEYISILPSDLDLSSHSHRYLRLPHARTGQPQLYLPYSSSSSSSTTPAQRQQQQLLEVTRLNGSRRRTWFIGANTIDSGTILLHHPVDPLYLVAPLILDLLRISPNAPYQPLSDLFSTLSSSPTFALAAPFTPTSAKVAAPEGTFNPDIAALLELKAVRRVFKLCCDRKEVPSGPPSPPASPGPSTSTSTSRPQVYYRPNQVLLLKLLKLKVEHFATQDVCGLFDHVVRSLGRDGLLGEGVDAELVDGARRKTAIEHISQYLPPSLSTALADSYDFSRLATHLANMSAAQLAAAVAPTSSKADKAGGAAAAAANKRKGPAASRGVETLKKVNTGGMKKLTSFFGKKGEK